MSDTVLKIENLYKRYRLGIVNHTAFADDFRILWSKITGQPDPTETYITANDLVNAKKGEIKAKYVWALQDINLEVKHGEILGVIGKNGAGKSTLLKILSKTTAPTKGNVKVKGRVASLLEVGTGFHPELTGRENIYLNGMILGMKKREIDKKLDEIIDFAGIETYLDTPTKRYSSGMNVRLGFAVAAHLEPDILIVDEVLAVGDADFQKKAIGKMQEVSRGQGRTVLFVSHNIGSVKALCTRAILVENGKLVMVDDTVAVANRYMRGTEDNSGIFELGRQSTQERVVFQKAILKNQRGETTTDFHIGDQLTVELHCYTAEAIEHPYFWISINSMYGSIFSANALMDGCCPKRVEGGDFIVCCTWADLSLLPQTFTITAGARASNGSTLLTQTKEVASFNIITKVSDMDLNGILAETISTQSSPLMLPYTWEFDGKEQHYVNLVEKKSASIPVIK